MTLIEFKRAIAEACKLSPSNGDYHEKLSNIWVELVSDKNEFPDSEYKEFISQFNTLKMAVKYTAEQKGFWLKEDFLLDLVKGHKEEAEAREIIIEAMTCTKIALEMTEKGEKVEAIRKGNPVCPKDGMEDFTETEEEAADEIIRMMDLAGRRGWRLAECIVAKCQYNKIRPYLHGKKF